MLSAFYIHAVNERGPLNNCHIPRLLWTAAVDSYATGMKCIPIKSTHMRPVPPHRFCLNPQNRPQVGPAAARGLSGWQQSEALWLLSIIFLMHNPSTPSYFTSPFLVLSRHFDWKTASTACFSICSFPSEKLRKSHLKKKNKKLTYSLFTPNIKVAPWYGLLFKFTLSFPVALKNISHTFLTWCM